jgi:hypothetical protein
MSQSMSKVYGPSDAGRELNCSAATVKRIAADLRIDPLLTVTGARLFTADQVERIRVERTRRAKEMAR